MTAGERSSGRAGLAAPGRPEAPLGWTAQRLHLTYPTSRTPALSDVTLEVSPGACTAVLGPNGSGKSTLLRVLLGLLRAPAGVVQLGGVPIERWSRRDLARTVGVLAQHEEIAFPLTVRELVAMGRYPHLGPFRPEGATDRAAIAAAMERCDVHTFADRLVGTLSSGERQRARLARALAQQPRLLALDEPTLALDIRHEMEIFELLRELVGAGVTVLLITHNLNLAARYADRLVLLDRGRLAAAGPPAHVLGRERLEAVYQWPLRTLTHPGPGRDTGALQITPLAADARPGSDARENPL